MRKHFGKRAGFGVKRNVAVSGTGLPYSCVCVCVYTGSSYSAAHTHTHPSLSHHHHRSFPNNISDTLSLAFTHFAPGLALTLQSQGGLPFFCALPLSRPCAPHLLLFQPSSFLSGAIGGLCLRVTCPCSFIPLHPGRQSLSLTPTPFPKPHLP